MNAVSAPRHANWHYAGLELRFRDAQVDGVYPIGVGGPGGAEGELRVPVTYAESAGLVRL